MAFDAAVASLEAREAKLVKELEVGVAGAQAALDDEAAAFLAARYALSDLAADIRVAATGGPGAQAAQFVAAFPALRARLAAAFASAAALPAPRVAAAAIILDLAPVDRVARGAPTLGELELVEVCVCVCVEACP